jgi:PTS system cellobiose-specific IIA component
MDEKIIEISTQVLIHAGNARGQVEQAMRAAEESQAEEARKLIAQAEEEIALAHQVQTQLIQSEARGETLPMSILLCHAQDTLMTAMAELHMARHIVYLANEMIELKRALSWQNEGGHA